MDGSINPSMIVDYYNACTVLLAFSSWRVVTAASDLARMAPGTNLQAAAAELLIEDFLIEPEL